MNRQTKIDAVVKAAHVSREVARQYLEAEEWLVDEAVCDIRAERKQELKANIATLAALEALELMAKKSDVEPKVIMDAVLADPEGNTARYFSALIQTALREVPKLLAA
ncbi:MULTISPECIES: hypothetical protein [Pseudomonas]|uniref:Uncharacterized protein n=1 Tax=Pseudomonas syringae pv. papulans TaxID=83963 RepID=A0AA43DZG6_PSESX|nr:MULTISPECIES: hypothetical protein [Pseudomonas]MDH4603715.1 hypothetical protein [Pseudomonas syringae pv. papulans]MDH4625526.1 hypothetical protein [Pseudomonas syringae pv. papulans]